MAGKEDGPNLQQQSDSDAPDCSHVHFQDTEQTLKSVSKMTITNKSPNEIDIHVGR